jgi:hypothetical protein
VSKISVLWCDNYGVKPSSTDFQVRTKVLLVNEKLQPVSIACNKVELYIFYPFIFIFPLRMSYIFLKHVRGSSELQ